MSDATTAAAAADAGTTTPAVPSILSLRDAVEAVAKRREAAGAQANTTPQHEPRDHASGRSAAEQSAPQGHDPGQLSGSDPSAAPGEGESGEIDPAELPSIEPPRSWTAEEKERFAKLPRETQEFIALREHQRDAETSRRFNEAANQRKAAEAQRTEYEAKLPAVLMMLNAQIAGEFGDLRSMNDVAAMAEADPVRFNKLQARLMQVNQISTELKSAQERQMSEAQVQFSTWAEEQDAAFVRQHREFADPRKGSELRNGVAKFLTDVVGLVPEEIDQLHNTPLFRDAKAQSVLYKAFQFHQAQEARKAATAAPKPAPQRPGTGSQRTSPHDATIKALEAKLANATSTREQIDLGAALLAARRAARAA